MIDDRLKKLFNIAANGFGSRCRCVSLHNLSFLVDEKLFKIPFDHLQSKHSWLLFLQVSIDWMLIGAIDSNLLCHGEGHSIIALAECSDFLITGHLLRERVGGKSNDNQSFVFIAVVELLQAFELGSEAALGSRVEGKDYFAFKLAQIDWFPGSIVDLKVVE